ncbi:helix-turn-helix transcriptional regulator [Micromonospora sp. WMMD1102]|uniref:helix-turn-helix domain-containing protein n=1 Tax=Micromonospora sp. WMMD1102 TaxID=3016105 RepID=UPI002414E21C|nr:helix-turn-helix transcriptional regulator [Micromonospora sp. WMMD1102]MDG4789079.1 helix-turn-helix transcriptional regulator [Micromonospora sp. WMMD1102]
MVVTQHRPFIRTLRAQWLGQRLRDLREQRGMSLELVAEHLNRDRSALGRYERAEWPIQRHDVLALLDLYGFHRATERAELLNLADEVWRTDRWTDNYGDLVDASFIDFPWLESRANTVCSYHAMVIPGLFQLREYASQVIRCVEGPNATEANMGRWIELRMERQRVLDEPGTTKFETIIDESALRRQIGGSALLRAQLIHLDKINQHNRVDIRVLPSNTWLHPGLDGSFWLFRMPKLYPEVAYLESLAGQMYFESPKAAKFVSAYDRLREAALGPRESAHLIRTIAEDLA